MTILVLVQPEHVFNAEKALSVLNCEVEAQGHTPSGYAFQLECAYTPTQLHEELRLRFGLPARAVCYIY